MHGGVRISYMHFRFAWSANLGHSSWHLKETVAQLMIYKHVSYSFEKSSTSARLSPGSRVCFKVNG